MNKKRKESDKSLKPKKENQSKKRVCSSTKTKKQKRYYIEEMKYQFLDAKIIIDREKSIIHFLFLSISNSTSFLLFKI